jgi:excisionase family DNA binding protein
MTTLVALSKALGVSLDYLTSPRHGQDLQSVVMLRLGQAARLLGIHSNTLRRWADAGVLPSHRLGSRGDRRFRKTDIQKLLALKRF